MSNTEVVTTLLNIIPIHILDVLSVIWCRYLEICTSPHQSSRGDFLSPLTPPYMPFGIRRFNLTSRRDAHYNNQDSL